MAPSQRKYKGACVRCCLQALDLEKTINVRHCVAQRIDAVSVDLLIGWRDRRPFAAHIFG
jgi:hypothetical protein